MYYIIETLGTPIFMTNYYGDPVQFETKEEAEDYGRITAQKPMIIEI